MKTESGKLLCILGEAMNVVEEAHDKLQDLMQKATEASSDETLVEAGWLETDEEFKKNFPAIFAEEE